MKKLTIILVTSTIALALNAIAAHAGQQKEAATTLAQELQAKELQAKRLQNFEKPQPMTHKKMDAPVVIKKAQHTGAEQKESPSAKEIQAKELPPAKRVGQQKSL